MSDLKPLARVRDITGKRIQLGMFESVSGLLVTEDRVTLSIERAKVVETHGEYRIPQRGRTLYTFVPSDFNRSGWKLADTLTVWWSTDETHARRDRKPTDQEWTDLCHRPGTARNPLDNGARQRQGY